MATMTIKCKVTWPFWLKPRLLVTEGLRVILTGYADDERINRLLDKHARTHVIVE